ncbi:hypothetical protein CS542_06485 [Pedobacter sp. IW39]|nr:hypothetical protein CS542_06485 [Pedobacter sp. IW39]
MVIGLFTLALIAWGIFLKQLPIDAVPDANNQVQVVTKPFSCFGRSRAVNHFSVEQTMSTIPKLSRYVLSALGFLS